jgi:hypothetical protein
MPLPKASYIEIIAKPLRRCRLSSGNYLLKLAKPYTAIMTAQYSIKLEKTSRLGAKINNTGEIISAAPEEKSTIRLTDCGVGFNLIHHRTPNNIIILNIHEIICINNLIRVSTGMTMSKIIIPKGSNISAKDALREAWSRREASDEKNCL